MLSPSQAHQSVKAQTTAGILSKTMTTVMQKRVAHTPTLKVNGVFYNLLFWTSLTVQSLCISFILLCSFQSSTMKRPIIPTEYGAKIPTNIRQRYLNVFIDECVKFCPSEDAAFQMVQHEWQMHTKQLFCRVSRSLYWRHFYQWHRCGCCFRALMRRSWCTIAAAARTSTSV